MKSIRSVAINQLCYECVSRLKDYMNWYSITVYDLSLMTGYKEADIIRLLECLDCKSDSLPSIAVLYYCVRHLCNKDGSKYSYYGSKSDDLDDLPF